VPRASGSWTCTDGRRARDAKRPRRDTTRKKNEAGHVRAECALRDHPALGRWLTQQPSGRLTLNRAKLEAERGFRDLKSDLLLRPVFHRLEHRSAPTC
jgi:hypothetical protein